MLNMSKLNNSINQKKQISLVVSIIIFSIFTIMGLRNMFLIDIKNTFLILINILGLVINFLMLSISVYYFIKIKKIK